ncbi:hypothetical protein TrRE_jg54 [Triparma retinervis]|uniref:Uncharacterized protein n=1 Tax=Triparma retinervis TaxID=2557542 RepID=A0A9W7A6S5_9STRA|nr:hypothetical protein TrRE_jg54 [Triparma retinervis]
MLATAIICLCLLTNTVSFQFLQRQPATFITSRLKLQERTDPTSDVRGLGFDAPTNRGQAPTSNTRTSDDKLRESLRASAKFKVKNDARLTWLTISLSSLSLSFLTFAHDPALQLIGLPDLGAGGAAAEAAVGALAFGLFVKPEGLR